MNEDPTQPPQPRPVPTEKEAISTEKPAVAPSGLPHGPQHESVQTGSRRLIRKDIKPAAGTKS